jgi:hypothetical protein
MLKKTIGLILGILLFVILLTAPPPGMTPHAAKAAAVAVLMAI